MASPNRAPAIRAARAGTLVVGPSREDKDEEDLTCFHLVKCNELLFVYLSLIYGEQTPHDQIR